MDNVAGGAREKKSLYENPRFKKNPVNEITKFPLGLHFGWDLQSQ